MATPSKYYDPRDPGHVKSPDNWTNWPVQTMKERTDTGKVTPSDRRVGLLYAEDIGTQWRIHLINLHELATQRTINPKKTVEYPSMEALLAEWTVD